MSQERPTNDELVKENERLKAALLEIFLTKTQHLRSAQMQAAIHDMKAKARRALEKCPPTGLERALPWL